MFRKLRQLNKDLQTSNYNLEVANKEAKKIAKELNGMKKTIDAYKRQGAALLLEDLDEELIKKLQSFTEDNIIIIYCKDGTRMEIKSNETNYKKETGAIR